MTNFWHSMAKLSSLAPDKYNEINQQICVTVLGCSPLVSKFSFVRVWNPKLYCSEVALIDVLFSLIFIHSFFRVTEDYQSGINFLSLHGDEHFVRSLLSFHHKILLSNPYALSAWQVSQFSRRISVCSWNYAQKSSFLCKLISIHFKLVQDTCGHFVWRLFAERKRRLVGKKYLTLRKRGSAME